MRIRARRGVVGILGIAILPLLCWWTLRLWTRGAESPGPSREEVLATIHCGPIVSCAATDDVDQMEQRVRAAARSVLPAVVAVRNPIRSPPKRGCYDGYASGVIVTEDGIVLSQLHVSHRDRSGESEDEMISAAEARTFLAGEKTTVILHDGRECPAELLGADRTRDLSLLRILEPGPYPFVPIDLGNEVQLGDWILKVGHPLGYRRERSAPVRFGRVLSRINEAFATDCGCSGGDSGGPFFDLDGRLVGIVGHSAVMAARVVTKNDPLLSIRAGSRNIFCCTSSRSIHDVFDQMLAGDIVPYMIEEYPCLDTTQQLRAVDWTQGRATRRLFSEFVAPARLSVVAVLNEGVAVALGTVVDHDYVITKATELPSRPACRLPDGRIVSAQVVGAEPTFDLALLKVEATGLKPITWSGESDPPVGTLLAAVGLEELPLAVGVVSAGRYNTVNPRPPTYSLPLRVPAYRPGFDGSAQHSGGCLAVWEAAGLAWSAGVRPDDVVRKVAGRDIFTDDDVANAVAGHLSGDVVSMEIERNNETLRLCVVLIDDRPGKPNGPPNRPGSIPPGLDAESGVIIIEIADSDIF